MNAQPGMANVTPMGGPVGAPMPMMNNNAAMNPQMAAAAAAGRQVQDQRSTLNTYIYEYFLRHHMYDCARSLLASDQQVNVNKEAGGRRENGNAMNGVDDPMDTDSKDDSDSKLPDDLPPPKLPMPASDTSFLYEWFCVFWDIYTAPRAKNGNHIVNQYVQHTQQQQRMKQSQQQEMLRQMRPEISAQQYQAQAFMRNMQNTNMTMAMKQQQHQTNLARAAMANNQNPGMQQMLQAKQNPMQRDPSGMDANRDRPSSPASGENAPSPSKRQRIDGAPFNANQPGAMMNGGRPGQNMPGQPMAVAGNVANAQQVLAANGINPNQLNPQQMQNFANTPPAAQQKSIATYSHNLQQHHGNQMGSKQMVGGVPQNQSSPMMAPGGPDGNALNAFYNPNMDGPNAMRAGGQAQPTGSNHALQDYQMQLMLLEQQNKKRLMMARQEQSDMGGIPRDNQPGAAGPNGQPFPDTSPQAMRSGASPNPAEQMKRGTPQMNNSGISSPVPDGAQSRESPNPAMNFLGNHVNVSMAPHFYKGQTDENMAAAQAQMNGMRPPSSHPGQPFNGPMNAQQMMAARQGVPGNPQQWQGMNGQMVPGGMPQQGQPVQGTPQQRSMPPPSAPAAANANNRTTASPQQAAAAPPTPSQSNKAAPKKKESKSAKDKRLAAQKKGNQNNNAAASTAENGAEAEVNAPATPITPVVAPGSFKAGQAGGPTPNASAPTATTGVPAPAAAASAPVPQAAAPVPQPAHDLVGGTSLGGMESNFGMDFGAMDMNPLGSTDVLNDFDFDSFLNDGDNGNEDFVFTGGYSGMEGGEIGAE
ncbi:hypothetical protein TGAM01_v202376 [Trichoderma gamsii]|uniref:Uncharacterized protein n=1 Tax=Trichoderma gamsii TaxID=398673 RepID=A0A2P4ZW65_9HYPO|nr:hypothetical protein TGAM01_v202376 [Trichoderma gamsii]PON28529.1 hypothetical protein TGAM01_v202376 [Trichoderma gamsii]